jgi:hypothetical protein
MVAVIGPDSHIKFTPINLAGTDGKVIRIESGLEENVRVALNLPNTVADGAKVTVAGAPSQTPASTTAASPPAAGAKSASGGQVRPASK